MCLNVRVLLWACGLIACSHQAAAPAPRAPDAGPIAASKPNTTAPNPAASTSPTAKKSLVLAASGATTPVTGRGDAAQHPEGASRAARTESNDESDLAQRQRIRQSAMADSLL